MKMEEALKIIMDAPKGFRVAFEWKRGCILAHDSFPGRNEPLIETEAEAWALAKSFAAKTKGKCVNIYVTHHDLTPVRGYQERCIENR